MVDANITKTEVTDNYIFFLLVESQTHRETLSITVAPEWFVLRLVIMETTRTGGTVTSGVCTCVCVISTLLLHVMTHCTFPLFTGLLLEHVYVLKF